MAQKRMFDKSVVFSDLFLEMPDSTQNLYFFLNMEADDDGFVNNWKSIMKMISKKEDDLKILIAKKFVLPFDSGIIVIKHWRINNYLRKDRYNETKFLKEKSQLIIDENQEYSYKDNFGIPMVATDKNRIEENSIEYIYTPSNENKCDIDDIRKMFDSFWQRYPKKRDKGNTEKWFDKNKPTKELVELMIKQIERFKDTEDWKKQDGKFIPYPTTWLNGKMWEDEFETDAEKEEREEREILNGNYYGT